MAPLPTTSTAPTEGHAQWTPPAGVYTVSKTFSFAAAHHLTNAGSEHKCARTHGHTWTVTVEVTSNSLVGPGWVSDFGDLAPLGVYINDHLDHRDLNEVLPPGVDPTSEHLAALLATWCMEHLEPHIHGRVSAVTVSEGPRNRATFRPGGEHTR